MAFPPGPSKQAIADYLYLSRLAGGGLALGGGGLSTPQLMFTPNSGAAMGFGMANGGSILGFFAGLVNAKMGFYAGGLIFNNDGALAWTNASNNPFTTQDLLLWRDAADTHAWRDGTTAQAGRIYNTWTDASNGEWASFDWKTTANLFRIRSQANGTGTVRGIAIDAISKAGAAANTDIPAGTWALLRDTSGATTKLIYNNGGTIMSVSLT